MKKHLFIYTLLLLFAVNTFIPAYAADMSEFDADARSNGIYAFYLEDQPKLDSSLLLSDDSPAQSLDYSLLDNILTVEVSNHAGDAGYSLIVVEYGSDDLPQNTHIINDVQSKNVIGRINGDYARAFLWNTDNMYAYCPSISTKTDYDIIEGADGDWTVSEDGHTLYSYTGEAKNVIIPNSYHGKRIKTIYNRPAISKMTNTTTYREISLFEGRTDIESFVISEGVAQLGPCAFAGCTASCELTIPKTLIYIGNYAFRGCQNLTGDVDLSSVRTLQTSGGQQFAFCSSLNGTLTLPSVEVIPTAAFYECSAIGGAINIQNGTKIIDSYAFSQSGTPSFTALNLPDTLTSIGVAAFQKQTRLKNELILPCGLEHIADFAFNHCSSIPNTVMEIPASLKTIGGDSSDSEGNYVNTGYGGHVFYDSFKKLTRFEVPDDNMYFKAVDGVLYSKDIKRLVAYPSAKQDAAFTVPEGVTQIDEMALGYSKFTTLILPDSYVISESVPANIINNKANTLAVAMYHYNNLKTVLVKETNPNYISADGIIYSKNGTELWYVPPKITGAITVSNGCESMMSGCCWMESNNYNGEVYTSIYIPASVGAIHQNTLEDLNRKTNNSQTRFIINLDSQNQSFIINQNGSISAR